MSWNDYSSAPAPGTPICDMPATDGVRALTVSTDRGAFPVLLVCRDGAVRAYVNACPHQYLPLDYRGDRMLSADGARLMCTAHGAEFDIDTGAPIRGADCGLDAIPIRLIGQTICVGVLT